MTNAVKTGAQRANNILVHRTSVQRGRSTQPGYAVVLRYNYTPVRVEDLVDEVFDPLAPLPVPNVEFYDPAARNQLNGLGAYCTRPNVSALVTQVAAMRAAAGRDLPVQWNGEPDEPGVPADWSRTTLTDADFRRAER